MAFDQALTNSQIAGLYSQVFFLIFQSKAVNSQFTTYTIVIRYVFFTIAIAALILYLLRYLKIPVEKRII